MTIIKRLKQFIDYKGYNEARKGKSLRNFYDQIGVANNSIVEGRNIGINILDKIFDKYPELNMDWVITGRGEMLYKEPKLIAAESEAKYGYKDKYFEVLEKYNECLESKQTAKITKPYSAKKK